MRNTCTHTLSHAHGVGECSSHRSCAQNNILQVGDAIRRIEGYNLNGMSLEHANILLKVRGYNLGNPSFHCVSLIALTRLLVLVEMLGLCQQFSLHQCLIFVRSVPILPCPTFSSAGGS